MELVLGLLVIAVVGYFVFFRKQEDQTPATTKTEDTPPQAETPVPAQDVAPQPVIVVAEGAGAVVIPPAPVAEEAPAKKPRKPRAPKAEPAKKPAAKKAAPKKAAAIKATKKSKKA